MFDMGPVDIGEVAQTTRLIAASWSKVLAYSQATLAITEPWELRAVHAMARAYAQVSAEARDPLCIPPHKRDAE